MKQQTRARLIAATFELSAQRGFAALSLREVTKAAGISPAAFYRHFHDMEDLGFALLDEIGLSLRKFLREARLRVQNERGAVETSVNAFLNYINQNRNLFRLFLGERQGASPRFRKAVHAEIDQFVTELKEDLERDAEATSRPLLYSGYAAEAIIAVVFTVGAEALELPTHKQESLAMRLVQEVKMILRGARARSSTPPVVPPASGTTPPA